MCEESVKFFCPACQATSEVYWDVVCIDNGTDIRCPACGKDWTILLVDTNGSQPCGHPLSAIEGSEPSFYCSMCEKEG